MKVVRKKISPDTEAEVMFQSDRQCCIDKKRGDHIHHIDGNNSNSDFDNLALLCFDCHNEATIKGSLRKKLSAKTIIKYRAHHYEVIQNNRNAFIKKLNHPIQKLTSNDLLNAAKEAIIIIEIEKLKLEYLNATIPQQEVILNKFDVFENHVTSRTAYEVLTFLVRVTYGTRHNMHPNIAQQIYFLSTSLLRASREKYLTSEKIQLGIEVLSISSNMFYDSTIHLNNLEIAQWALLATKNVYVFSKVEKVKSLTDKAKENFDKLEKHLIRPERNDLENAKALIKIYREDLVNNSLSFAPLPDYLERLVKSTN